MDLGRIVIRGIVGPLFIGHGTQKLFGWFQGAGLEGTGGFFESLGLKPGKPQAAAAGAAETAGGALLLLGALTPLAASLISGSMITAVRTAHAGKGPWVTGGGYEYNLVLLGAMAAIAQRGPGRPSVDCAVFPDLKGTKWAIAQLAAAAAGSFAATQLAPSPPEEEQAGGANGRAARLDRESAGTPA